MQYQKTECSSCCGDGLSTATHPNANAMEYEQSFTSTAENVTVVVKVLQCSYFYQCFKITWSIWESLDSPLVYVYLHHLQTILYSSQDLPHHWRNHTQYHLSLQNKFKETKADMILKDYTMMNKIHSVDLEVYSYT